MAARARRWASLAGAAAANLRQSSRAGASPSAGIHKAAVSGPSASGVAATELQRIGRSSGRGLRFMDSDSGILQSSRGASLGFARQASATYQPTAASPADGEGVEKESQEQQPKTDKEEARTAEEKEEEEEEVLDEKTQTLRAALAHVPRLGWTEAALAAGAADLGLSPAMAGAFPRKEAALVEFFMEQCTQAMVEELESRDEELLKLGQQDRIALIVWMRLEMQIPYLSKWAQALSIQANPMNLATTLKQRALLIDDIWHTAGDRSADMDWYAKRAMLGGVYSTTELYMLTDTSSGFKDTKTFLERRINDALDCRKTVQEAGHLAQAVGAGLQNTLNTFLNQKRPSSGFGF